MLMLHKYSYFRAAMKDIPPLASSFFGIADGGGGGGGSSKRYVSGASDRDGSPRSRKASSVIPSSGKVPESKKKEPSPKPKAQEAVKAVSPPKVDFSAVAVSKAVRNTTIQHPLTLYPTVVGVLGAVALGLSLLDPTLITFSLVCGSFGVGIGSFGVNYLFRKDRFASEYMKSMSRELETFRQKTLENLQAELEDCRSVSGGEGYANQALGQFAELKEKFDAYCDILGKRFNETEITYGRYRGTAEQLYLAAIDNLCNVATLLESAKAIDNDDYIARRLAELSKLGNPTDVDTDERKTLEERRNLRTGTLKKVHSLLKFNEEAMTQIDKTIASLADVKTKQGEAVVDMETSLKDLEELAKRASSYARQ